jgi:hypothetical protein
MVVVTALAASGCGHWVGVWVTHDGSCGLGASAVFMDGSLGSGCPTTQTSILEEHGT